MRALRDREARLRARRLIRFLARWLSLRVCDLDLREVRERVLIVAPIPLSVSSNDRRKKTTRRTSAEPLYDIAPCAIPGNLHVPTLHGTCQWSVPPAKIQQLCDSKRLKAAWQQKSNVAEKSAKRPQANDY